MNLHYQYYWFKEVIPHDICDKIIQMGNKRIEQVKKNGNDASGTTSGGSEKKEDERISAKELTPKQQLETNDLNVKVTHVDKGEFVTFKSGRKMPKWYNDATTKERGKIRSKTFPGIAKAMAAQFSEQISLLINQT